MLSLKMLNVSALLVWMNLLKLNYVDCKFLLASEGSGNPMLGPSSYRPKSIEARYGAQKAAHVYV